MNDQSTDRRTGSGECGSAEHHPGAAMRKGWPEVEIGDAFKTSAGGTPLRSKKQYFDGGTIPWLMSGEVAQREIFSCENFITPLGLQNCSARLLPIDSVLIAMYGATAGQVGILKFEACTNQAVCAIHPNDRFLPPFVYYALLAQQQQLIDSAVGNAQPNLSQIKLRKVRVPVPPLAEQQRIVGILDEAFEGIATAKANAEKNLQNAHALFESHLQAVFTQRGEGWEEKRLEEVCTFSSGGTPSKSNDSYWNGDIPWISGRDMKSSRLWDSQLHISRAAVDESSTRLAPPGALLVLVRGMGLAHGAQIGELMVPSAFNQDIRALVPSSDLLPRFLLFAVRDGINSGKDVLSNAAHGTLKIDTEALKGVAIPVPPIGQQRQIIKTIDGLSEETQRLATIYERKLAAVDDLKKSLLHQAFSGNL